MLLYFTRGTINADLHLYPDDPSLVELVADLCPETQAYKEISDSFRLEVGVDLRTAICSGATSNAFYDRSLQKCFYAILGQLMLERSRIPVTSVGFFSAGILAAGPVAGLFSMKRYWDEVRPLLQNHFEGLKQWERECDWTQVLVKTECPIESSVTYRNLAAGLLDDVFLKDRRGRFAAIIAGDRAQVKIVTNVIGEEVGMANKPSLESRPINAAHTSRSNNSALIEGAARISFTPPKLFLYGANGSAIDGESSTQDQLAHFFCEAIDGPLDTRGFLQRAFESHAVIHAIGSERAIKMFEGRDMEETPEIRLVTSKDFLT